MNVNHLKRDKISLPTYLRFLMISEKSGEKAAPFIDLSHFKGSQVFAVLMFLNLASKIYHSLRLWLLVCNSLNTMVIFIHKRDSLSYVIFYS